MPRALAKLLALVILSFAAALPAAAQPRGPLVLAAASLQESLERRRRCLGARRAIRGRCISFAGVLGAGAADRSGRAGRPVHLGRRGVDGLCRAASGLMRRGHARRRS